MLIHTVYFWLKEELTDSEREAFVTEVHKLDSIDHISAAWLGSPAAIEPRPTVDTSYDYALTLMFADVAHHDAYQVDPIHKSFISHCRNMWSRVQIYDSDAKGLQG